MRLGPDEVGRTICHPSWFHGGLSCEVQMIQKARTAAELGVGLPRSSSVRTAYASAHTGNIRGVSPKLPSRSYDSLDCARGRVCVAQQP
ncbi:hypothetical protein K466DRAFT_48377 [Polyporus arcularius HHB13444]|uniref:Uncharacterized protein n=1 Tax=Polyporus arcularius HHB13444 TaxID=1314778 RepID=A0A5C3PVL9_9APHY|nr:hypothetical protein K466DRAFT_48377 [Polyporus arcularius HHB13444]